MQYSVFRCWMTPAQMHELRWELTQVLEPEDEVLLIPLCPRCVAGMETTHSARNVPDWPDEPEGSGSSEPAVARFKHRSAVALDVARDRP